MIEQNKALPILRKTLGTYWQTSKNEFYFNCPACKHHKPKFAVNISKNVFHCWVCDYRGRSIRRIIRRFGSFLELQKWDQITDREDISRFSELFSDKEVIQPPPAVDIPKEFVSLANKKLPLSANRAIRYLSERGIGRQQIQRWKIGFCYDGQYGGRIVVPSFGMDGNANYFVARSFVGHNMKYRNPPSCKNMVLNELFVNWNQDLVLVEGVFDAIKAGNSVPILGSSLHTDSKLLRKIVKNDTPCYIALDPDAAEKERRIIQTLLRYDVELYKIDVSGYEDVGAMSYEEFELRKSQATFIDRENYILMDMLSAV